MYKTCRIPPPQMSPERISPFMSRCYICRYTKRKMGDKNFHISITVKGPREEAFARIAKVSSWWAKDVTGNAEKQNGRFTVRFGETFVDFEVTEWVPGSKVVWKVTGSNLHWADNKQEWTGTEVVYQLSEKEGKVQIDFTHIGLVPGLECYSECREGWTGYITGSLLDFINTGKGSPG